MAQLAALAAAGDFDGVANFTTSRTRRNYALIADYRDALLHAVSAAGTTPSHVATAIASPVPAAPVLAAAGVDTSVAHAGIPSAPTLTGSNPNNAALISAQRRARSLEAAARSQDPVAAILAIQTTRHNYMRAVDDYRSALLAHFGYSAGGQPLVPSAEVASAPTAARARRSRPSASRSAAPQPQPQARQSVPPSQNPEIAANPLGLPESVLGFVPRPNVPLTVHTNSLPTNFQWPRPEMEELNRRYLAQPTALQARARDYQSGSWVPETPEVTAARAAAAREQAARDRAALRESEQRRASIPDLFKPRAEVGANVTGFSISDGALRAARGVCGITSEAELRNFASTIVADFGGAETFSISVAGHLSNSFSIRFVGSNGTDIRRKFSRIGDKVEVCHALFEAASTGAGSGRNLFRTSMGLYKAYGISSVGVKANFDVGGYAWARFGYVPRSWGLLRAELVSRVREMAQGTLRIEVRNEDESSYIRTLPAISEDHAGKLLRLLESDDPRTVWAIADMKLAGRDIGRELLLGTSWPGVIDLNDDATMSRFTAYVTPRGGS